MSLLLQAFSVVNKTLILKKCAQNSQVSVVHGDLREVDLSDATVVITYLLPEAMEGLAESHLIPFLLRDPVGEATSQDATTVGGDVDRQSRTPKVGGNSASTPCANTVDNQSSENDIADHGSLAPRGGKPSCRIVCNTWGIPGAVAVKEEGVGLYGGVKLRLFTSESLVK